MSWNLNIGPTRRTKIPAHDPDNADGLGILTGILTRIVSGDYSTAWWSCRGRRPVNTRRGGRAVRFLQRIVCTLTMELPDMSSL